MHTIINAQQKDKEIVVNILCDSFKDDPHINWLVGEGKNKQKRIKRLMSYAFEYSLVNGSVQITEDRKAVAMWKNISSHKMSLQLLLETVKFLLDFGVKRIVRITKMEKEISKRYPKAASFKYLWFIGTQPDKQGKGYGSALLRDALKKAEEEQHAVYLETTTDTNLAYYKKKGFVLYDKIIAQGAGSLTIFLLKRA